MRAVYRLGIAPGEADGEGEDHDMWFGSLKAARSKRAKLIEGDPRLEQHPYGEDYEIEKIVPAKLSPRQLLLAALNRAGWVQSREIVVKAYRPPERKLQEEEDE